MEIEFFFREKIYLVNLRESREIPGTSSVARMRLSFFFLTLSVSSGGGPCFQEAIASGF